MFQAITSYTVAYGTRRPDPSVVQECGMGHVLQRHGYPARRTTFHRGGTEAYDPFTACPIARLMIPGPGNLPISKAWTPGAVPNDDHARRRLSFSVLWAISGEG